MLVLCALERWNIKTNRGLRQRWLTTNSWEEGERAEEEDEILFIISFSYNL